MLALTTLLSTLYLKKLLSLQQLKEEEITKPIPATTLKEGNPTIVMLRNLTILNPGKSINKRK